MNSLHNKIMSRLVCTVLFVTVITLTVPYRHAEAAGAMSGISTSWNQLIANFSAKASAVSGSATAVNTGISATANATQMAKENVLDGLAWTIGKSMVSQITRSLINWVNSGFQGSPAFVTDIRGMLLTALDQTAGEYIQSLGKVGSFICSPFRLDVQVALNVAYERARSGMPSGPSEDMCTLTGIKSNIEGFLNGNIKDWNQWLKVTSNPQNLPYGAYLAAEAKLNARLVNAKGESLELASWGDGFLGTKTCKKVDGAAQPKCTVSTPGAVVQEMLTFQTTAGPRSLIEADEVNELVGALISQLALKAVQGVNGLLGLSQPGYEGKPGSFLDQAVVDLPGIDLTQYIEEITSSKKREETYLNLIDAAATEATLRLTAVTTTMSAADIKNLQDLVLESDRERIQVNSNITKLSEFITRYSEASTTAATLSTMATSSEKVTPDQVRQQVILDYLTLRSRNRLTSEGYFASQKTKWNQTLFPGGGNELKYTESN